MFGVTLKSARFLGAACCLAFLLAAGCATQPPASSRQPLSVGAQAERLTNGVATFDAAWRLVKESHYDPTFNGVDWDAVYTELRPRAEAATDAASLRKVIDIMLKRLGQSHMGLIAHEPSERSTPTPKALPKSNALSRSTTAALRGNQFQDKAEEVSRGKTSSYPAVSNASASPRDSQTSSDTSGDLGMEVRQIGRQIVVVFVDPNGPAMKAGVKPGWLLTAINQRPVTDILQSVSADSREKHARVMSWSKVTSSLRGLPGSMARVQFQNGLDQPVTLAIPRQQAPGELVKLGHLPTFYARLHKRRIQSGNGASIGYIQFNIWMLPIMPQFDEAIDEFRGTDGIVIDLRGNIGGVMGMLMGIAGHFMKERTSLGAVKMRDTELQIAANPRLVNAAGNRVQPFSGPVAILVDEISLSASEVFAGGMQSIGRARIFGQTTDGQALPALFDRLPNGDVLMHVLGDFVTSSGVRLEGRGVIPDVPVSPSRRDLLAGRDTVLDAAKKWIFEGSSSPLKSAVIQSSKNDFYHPLTK